jgi:hypothetical protein
MKVVPSDPISQPNSPPACYGTELRKPGSRGVVLLTPRRLLSNATDQCLQAHLPAFLAGTGISKRPFTLPKRLPVSRPPFRGPKLPTYSFNALPFVRPARSDSDSLTRSRFAPARARSLPKSRCLTPVRHSRPFLGSPLPFGAFRALKDQSVQPDSWPGSSPSEHSRWPITPRHRFYFISSDTRSPLQAR